MYKRSDPPSFLCLAQAAAAGDVDKVISIVSALSLDQQTLNQALLQATVHCTTASDHIQCVEVLLSKGAAVGCKGEDGVSAFMKACELGQIQLVELLWQRGAKVAEKGCGGRTPLHCAIDTDFGDNSDVVRFLVDQGADPNLPDALGRTPLHLAAMRGAAESLKVLLAAHARVKCYDKRRKTPLDLALEYSRDQCVTLLRTAANPPRPTEEITTFVRDQREVQKEDPCTLEIGEEVETKSGSSNTSNKASAFAECQTTALYSTREKTAERLVTIKRAEFREETEVLRRIQEEIAILTREKRLLERSLHTYQASAAEEETALTTALAAVRLSTLHKSAVSQPLLSLKKKQVGRSPHRVITALQEDIRTFVGELDVWQRRIAPVMERTVERWRSFVAMSLPGAQVKVYGSYANSLHLPSSDIDILILPNGLSVHETLNVLESRCHHEQWITSINYISAAYIPVLQLIVLQDGHSIRLDITVNESKHRGGKCTLVVRKMMREMEKLREVFLTLKQLVHLCDANQPFRGGLGSYSLFVMTAALMKREALQTSAEYVYRFFQYYGFEFQYFTPISIEDVEYSPSVYPALFVCDPSSPEFNTARSTNLPFLTVRATQHFLQLCSSHLCCSSACKCAVSSQSLLRTVLGARAWLHNSLRLSG